MVKSILNSDINYPEIRKLDVDDESYEADQYEISIMGNDVIIALGNAKYSFIEDNIIYFPIYLIKDQSVEDQIGVYEVLGNRFPNILDEDGDVDINELSGPLLYSFVEEDPDIIQSSKVIPDPSSMDSEEEESDPDEPNEITDIEESTSEEEDDETDEEDDKTVSVFDPLTKQTKEDADKERDNFKKTPHMPWIQEFMRNNNYQIVDNEGGGDCLFATIRDGLARVGKKYTVNQLRDILATEATEDVFQGYKGMYDMYAEAEKENKQELARLKKENTKLKKQLTEMKDRTKQAELVKKGDQLKKDFKKVKEENDMVRNLMGEFHFMRGIRTLNDFRQVIRSCNFWGETWAISTLERALNVKLIILSEQAYDEDDKPNVLQCGQLNDTVLEEKGVFNPDYYIILDHQENPIPHYLLITYKSRGAFTFNELPWDMKKLIFDKCMERSAGPYTLIPEFIVFGADLGLEISSENHELMERSPNLYNDNIVFQYYIRSAAAPHPGKGSGEKIPKEDMIEFVELASMPQWRRKLDNEWKEAFKLDSLKWLSVEHFLQASKFKDEHLDFYKQFSLDSGSEISKDVLLAKTAGSKSGKHKKERVRPKDIEIDSSWSETTEKRALEQALRAKFTQIEELSLLLKNTKNAKLVHYHKGQPAVASMELMKFRNKLKSSDKSPDKNFSISE